MANLVNINVDSTVSTYLELQTLTDVSNWKTAFKLCGKRSEYDMLFIKDDDSTLKIEVKAQQYRTDGYFFEYKQLNKQYKPENTTQKQLEKFTDEAPDYMFEPSGIATCKADDYYLYIYRNKDKLNTYLIDEKGETETDEIFFEYDLYIIPVNFLKNLLNSGRQKISSFNGIGYRLDKNELLPYLKVSTGSLSGFNDLIGLMCKKNFRLSDKISGIKTNGGSIPTVVFSRNCNNPLPKEAVIDRKRFPYYKNTDCDDINGFGKNGDSSGSSSESEEERKDLRTFFKKLTNKIKSMKK